MIISSTEIPKRVDVLTGQKFGRLLVLGYVGRGDKYGSFWSCRCECGAVQNFEGTQLRSGKAKSCGCLRAELTGRRFGKGTTRGKELQQAHPLEYVTFAGMIRRCHNPKAKDYPGYGARGRTVCDRWRFGDGEKSGFACFLEDMPPRTSRKLTIDRINNALGYFPGNCRWATAKEQAANK